MVVEVSLCAAGKKGRVDDAARRVRVTVVTYVLILLKCTLNSRCRRWQRAISGAGGGASKMHRSGA